MTRTSDWVFLIVPVAALLKFGAQRKAPPAGMEELYERGMLAMIRYQAKLEADEVERDGDTFWFPTAIKRYEFQRAIEWYKRCMTEEAPAHFNKLTPAEDERLAKLSEECAEVIQAVCKIQRHGYRSRDPDAIGVYPNYTNRELLQQEIMDVLIAVARLSKRDDIDLGNVEAAVEVALRTSGRYMHHQEPLDGTAAK